MACEGVYPKLGAHIGKYDGIFAPLCLIWHCIEERWIDEVGENVALRVERFLHDFLLPHAVAFYGETARDVEHDPVAGAAGHILAHRLDIITNRDLARSGRATKGLSRNEAAVIFERLEALGWVSQTPGPRPSSPPQWKVNEICHQLFAERAAEERERRQKVSKIMQGLHGLSAAQL